jgi:hypothetical protein
MVTLAMKFRVQESTKEAEKLVTDRGGEILGDIVEGNIVDGVFRPKKHLVVIEMPPAAVPSRRWRKRYC